tara:strand:+ start:7096 stop:8784 length:1689 start_codon:yes stop_codon:yes gene_type:complete
MKYLLLFICFPISLFAEQTGNLVINGTFENNNSNNWTTSGDVQVLGDCCGSNYDLEFGDNGSIEQSFALISDDITQPMLNNGITLNSSVLVQNGECGVSGCWGGTGNADTFTIRLQIRDENSNILATTTQERTNVTGINGKDFTDSVSYTGVGSNIGNLFISGSDANSPANLGGPNVDNISVIMTYDDTVLSVTQTSHITTTFQEIEEVLFSKVERVEFIPIEEFTFEVYEEPVVQMFEEIYIEEIAKEEINIGTINVFKEIPTEVRYEEPKTIETFSAEIQSFEERIETTESFNNTSTSEVIQEFFAEEQTIIETPNSSRISQRETTLKEVRGGAEEGTKIEETAGAGNESAPRENEERITTESTGESTVAESTPEAVEQTESNSSEPETETTVASEEVNEAVGEGEATDSESGNGRTETVASREDALESRDNEVEESRDSRSTRVSTQTISIESIEKKVNETLKRVDQRLVATSLIVARAMESPLSMDNYGQTNNNIFNNQLVIDGGSYDDQREYIDLRDIYVENQIAYNDPMAKSQKILQESIDNRIRAEEHLKRIRGY